MSSATITTRATNSITRRQRGGRGGVPVLDEASAPAPRPPRSGTAGCPTAARATPYSEIARAKDSAAPAAIAGARLGRRIRRRIVTRLAPSEAAASSTSASSSSSTGWTVRTTNGSVTKSQRERHGVLGERPVHAHRAVGPVERQQDQARDDRRQRERHVDDDVEQGLAREVVTDQHPGDDGAHHDVDGRDQEGLVDGQGDRGPGLRVASARRSRCPSHPRPR